MWNLTDTVVQLSGTGHLCTRFKDKVLFLTCFSLPTVPIILSQLIIFWLVPELPDLLYANEYRYNHIFFVFLFLYTKCSIFFQSVVCLYTLFSTSLFWLNGMSCRSLQMSMHILHFSFLSFLFSFEQDSIFHCMDSPHSTQPVHYWEVFHCFQSLAIMNNATITYHL